VYWFTGTCQNKIFKVLHLSSTSLLHLTELSEVFQQICFNFAQRKSSVGLSVNKLSDATAKSKPLKKLNVDWEKFESELGE